MGPVGKNSLHSRAILAYYKSEINRRNSLNIGGNMLFNTRKWRRNMKVIINYNTFQNCFRRFLPVRL